MEKDWISMIYDFERKTYDSTNWWATLGGGPTENATGLLFNAASAMMLGDFLKGSLEMKMLIPFAPAAGQFRQWGWREGGNGAYALFQVSGTTFSAVTGDGTGNNTSTTLTWNNDWNAAVVRFTIRWDASGFTFLVNDQYMTKISSSTSMPNGTNLAPYVANNGGDDMYLMSVKVTGSQQFTTSAQASGQVSAGRFANEIETFSITESLTVTVA